MTNLLIFFFLLISTSASSKSYCDQSKLRNPLSLTSDKITVLISGFSNSRIDLVETLALSYSSHPLVSSVLILWSNPSTPSSLLSPLLSLSSSSISLIFSSPSLSSRFLPLPQISTRSVLICDDDIRLSSSSLSFAFRISNQYPDAITGVFARSHEFDLDSRAWMYTVSPEKYSIVLTKWMILRTDYLHRFSCDERFREAREYVDRERNCEDILMNFVVAIESGRGPVLVEGKELRDFGDPRNEGGADDDNDDGEGGALSKRVDHRKKRGECIREFHRMIGEMPLKYSYGKVVEGVGEQGLCMKGGKLVYCDKE